MKDGKKKVRVGFFSFTCCEGCTIVLVEALNKRYKKWTDALEILNLNAIKTSRKIEKMDIAFIEGAISTKEELKKLKKIRKKSKKIIAFGSGADNGWPSNQRNNFSKEQKENLKEFIKKYNQLKTIEPIKKYIQVDDSIQGCPVNRNDVIKKIDSIIKNQN
ncbi:MAG: hypothetical protein ACOC1P_06340 [Minisyncoccales bacterium]